MFIQDKMIWRTFIRPLFENDPEYCGTPVTVTQKHLPDLIAMVNRISEFTRTPYQSGRVYYGRIDEQDLSKIHNIIEHLRAGQDVDILD